MPRDINGNFTLLPGINPVVPGTDIEADWANPTLNDIANAMSDSLSRTGSGGMLAPFKFADGTLAAPSITWTNQPQAGMRRAAADDFRYSINGLDVLIMLPAGVTIPVPLIAQGNLTVGGSVTVTGGVTITNGPVTVGGIALATINDAITYAVALG